ncbi:MAG: ABC transporter permease [Acidimicrobiales bacterium]|nr:ABC transporter permease [Acidimicrobiales bacterium]
MEDLIAYTILGLALGALYAVAAAGLVVTYTTSGIFNFAHGAIAMLAAYLYWQLRWDDGWGGQWPAPIAFVAVVFVAGPLFGALVERVIMRGLRDTSETTKIVIPIALLLALIGVANWVWGSPQARIPAPFFGATSKVDIGDVPIQYHQLIVFGIAIVLAIVLRILLFNTKLGVTMRAVVDNRELTQLNGGRPDRASMASWMIGSSIAALAGVLLSPIQGALSPLPLTLLVVNAYAAAVFGRLKNLPLTFGGAVLIGLAINYWNWVSEAGSKWGWLRGFRSSIPIVVLFIVLLLLPQERLRGAVVSRTRERFKVPSLTQAVVWGVVFVAIVAALTPLISNPDRITFAQALTFAIIALSIVLLTGYAGELNLAPLTFAGIGAMALFQWDVGLSRLATQESASVVGFILAALVSALVGTLIALPALRLRGLYLGLATFSFAVFVNFMVFQQNQTLDPPWDFSFLGFRFDKINLFSNGNLNVPRPDWFGVDFKDNGNWILFLSIVFAVLGIGLVALRRSSYGRRLSAMKDSPAACATLGMNLTRLKLSVFALACAIAGFGGALLAADRPSVTEENFSIFQSLPLFMLTVVGGVGFVTGGLIGGLMFGAAFLVIGDVFDKLATDYSALDWLFNFLHDWFTFVGPALAGIGLGKNPSGISNDFFEGYGMLRRKEALPITAVGLGAIVALYVAAATDAIGSWSFVLVTIGILLLLPAIAVSLRPSLAFEPGHTPDEVDTTADELIGIDRPFTLADRHRLDAELQLSELGYRADVEEQQHAPA